MKQLIFALALLTGFSVGANAQKTAATVQETNSNKTKVSSSAGTTTPPSKAGIGTKVDNSGATGKEILATGKVVLKTDNSSYKTRGSQRSGGDAKVDPKMKNRTIKRPYQLKN